MSDFWIALSSGAIVAVFSVGIASVREKASKLASRKIVLSNLVLSLDRDMHRLAAISLGKDDQIATTYVPPQTFIIKNFLSSIYIDHKKDAELINSLNDLIYEYKAVEIACKRIDLYQATFKAIDLSNIKVIQESLAKAAPRILNKINNSKTICEDLISSILL